MEKLCLNSIREIPKYPKPNTESITVDVDIRKSNIAVKKLMRNPLLVEQLTLPEKIPEILNRIKGQTIIYTQYVTGIVPEILKAVKAKGYSVAEHTGENDTGLELFLKKKVQVLVGSSPIATGVNGLQDVCDNLIISVLPWTNAQYQQLVGRLVRLGQKNNVNVYVIKANISGYPYDEKVKWKRILWKKTLADCAVDGIPPEKNMVTPEQATVELVKWLERMERGEISIIQRKDMNVELTPTPVSVQTKGGHYVVLGNISKYHKEFNNEYSYTTHQRFQQKPEQWEDYHKALREQRKTWSVDPLEEIIKRISQFSPRHQIGDFGCGEDVKIAEIFGSRVFSFDHIAKKPNVTVCDMKNTGLEDGSLDIAAFSLSMNAKNWPDYIIEAKRCLSTNGILMIAETTKKTKEGERLSMLRDVIKTEGFEIYRDEERGDFTFIEARKL